MGRPQTGRRRIAVIDHGQVIADGTPSELKASAGSGVLRIRLASAADRDRAQQALRRSLGVAIHPEPDPAALTARIAGGWDASRAVAQGMSELSGLGIHVAAFALGQPSLDEVFLSLTGHPARSRTGQPTGNEGSPG